MSQTLKGGLKHDTWALGKNTKKHFDRWDQNKDGQIDMDEVHWGLFYNSVKRNVCMGARFWLTWDNSQYDNRIIYIIFKVIMYIV